MELLSILRTSLMVGGFTVLMMLVVEYLNVLSRGALQRRLVTSGGHVPAVALGAVPGCLGGFADVALYVHGTISLGAFTGGMVAASGDEAFVMLALFPGRALLLFGILAAYGLVVARVVDRIAGNRRFRPEDCCESGLQVHGGEAEALPWPWQVPRTIRWPGSRIALTVGLVLFGLSVAVGLVGPDEEEAWLRWVLFGLTALALWLVLLSPEHFVREHLARHVVREHAARVFLWTLGALLVTEWLLRAAPAVEPFIHSNPGIALLVAAVLGLVPESGPHVIFATFYASGLVPFSVLVASSVVQDGHAMLPLLAESRREFIRVKAINLAAGLLLGGALFAAGF